MRTRVLACVCWGLLCSRVEPSLLAPEQWCVPQSAGHGVTAPSLLQPLKVVDPDHPLAALVRKAQADSPAPTPPAADGAAAQPSPAEYAADCEYLPCPPARTGRWAAQRVPRAWGQAAQACRRALASPPAGGRVLVLTTGPRPLCVPEGRGRGQGQTAGPGRLPRSAETASRGPVPQQGQDVGCRMSPLLP